MKNIKKLTSVILAVMLIFAMSSVAFAAPGSGTPIGVDWEQQRFVNEAVANYLEDEKDEIEFTVSEEDPNWCYRILDDGTLRVTTRSYSSAEEPVINNLVIPSTLDGKTVSEVRGVADWSTLSVQIPEGVTQIGWICLRNIQGLKRVIISASVTSICVNAFQLPDDEGVELYFCGTEEQWKNIVVWTPATYFGGDDVAWAVTDFNWLTNPYSNTGTYIDDMTSWVKDIHFNVDPATLEDLVPEEVEPEPVSPFYQIINGIQNFFASIVNFFKVIVSWFTFGK